MASKELVKKYIVIVGVIVGIFGLIAGAAFIVYSAVGTIGDTAPVAESTPAPTNGDENGYENGIVVEPTPTPSPRPGLVIPGLSPPDRTTVLILGRDQAGAGTATQAGVNTDVVLLVTLFAPTGQVDVISVPRDLRVTFSPELAAEFRAAGGHVPANLRLTNVYSNAGSNRAVIGPQFVRRHFNALFDIEIDHFVVLELAAFRNIVDIVGGVMFEVPMIRHCCGYGLFYEDEYQTPPLIINVPGGMALRDGRQAEGIVRYRSSFANEDIGRISMQQDFMRALFEQALSAEAIRANMLGYLHTIFSFIDPATGTDFVLTDLVRYISTLEQLDTDSIRFHTIPGTPGNFFDFDPVAGRTFFDEIFN